MLRFGYFDSEIIGTDPEGMPIFDRAETSDLFRLLFAKLVSNGVLAQPGDCFQVLASEGLTVKVRPGFGLIQGAFAYDDLESTHTLSKAPQQYARIDRVVLRANYKNRCCEIIVKEGTAAVTPVAPALLTPARGDYYELSLATIYIQSNATAITQSAITDTRGDSSVCGFITQLIDHLSTDTFYAQLNGFYQDFTRRVERNYSEHTGKMEEIEESLQGNFQSWFETVERTLTDTPVGNLSAQIDRLKGETIVTLPANAWSSSAPYSQKVSVPTVKATDSVTMGKAYTKDNTLEEIETWDEMAGLITSAEVSDGYVTFYSKSEKPSRTFKVKLKGVK